MGARNVAGLLVKQRKLLLRNSKQLIMKTVDSLRKKEQGEIEEEKSRQRDKAKKGRGVA